MPLPQQPTWYPEDPDLALHLADAIVVAHFAIVLFVILGEVAVLLGRPLRWRWTAGRGFRATHLAIILFVAGTAVAGDLCPLTIWENDLRRIAGRPIEQASFVAHWAHELLFVEVDIPTLTVCYVAFCLLVVASLWINPVRWRGASDA
jgi:hypothetical protein